MSIWIISAILLIVLVLLITEMIPVDLTAIAIMVALVVFGILSPREAVMGLAHPAVVTVGAMFVISRGMMRTGAVELIGRHVIRLSRGNRYLALVIILLTVGTASAFINNTPVVILFVPVVMTMCCEFGLSPSQFLIPVSYASILAGTCTLIGTSTNIIISDLSAASGFGAISMFELGRLGLPIALVGLGLMSVLSFKIMPSLSNPTCQLQDSDHRRYLAELRVPRGSRLIDMPALSAFSEKYPQLAVLEVIRYSHIFYPGRDHVLIAPDDLILVKGALNDLVEILNHEDVELPLTEKGLSFGVGKDDTLVVELIITPQSSLLGERLLETGLMQDPDIHVMAIKRHNLHFTERQIHDVRLRNGDMLLVWCKGRRLAAMRADKDYILIEDVHEEIVLKRKSWLAMMIFAGLIVSATAGIAEIMTCALTAAFLMIVTGCIQMRDFYRSLQGGVLLLIAGTIALGTAMEKTGTSRVYAEAFLSLFSGASPQMVLGGIILMTSISTQILSNNATAVLVFPIAVSTAISLGVDPRPFIVGVCFGASACFATPIGYQTNLLVYGPGGYRFSDFLKMGLPLNLMVIAAGTLFIPWIWPF